MVEPEGPKEPKGPVFPNKWIMVSIVLIILLIASISFNVANLGGGITGMAIGKQTAGEKIVSYLKSNFDVESQVNSINETSGLYLIDMTIQGEKYAMYMTKDGKMLFPTVFILADQSEPKETGLPKSDKPSVELFVMSECPYGTQAEKGILPVVELLGDKIDFNIRFVYYAMHGEKEVFEQLRQYCMQSEQKDNYHDYLSCYLNSGNSTPCLTEAGIDTSKLSKCMASADAQFNVTKNFNDQASWLSGKFPLFDIDLELNEKYQVQGSPTLVINGVQAQSGRDPANMLSTICSAFNTAPTECNTKLSTETPSAGFGGGTGTDGGSCG